MIRDLAAAEVFSTNGQTLITGSADTTVRFWDLKTGREYGMLKGHKAGAAFDLDARVVQAVDQQALVFVLRVDQRKRVGAEALSDVAESKIKPEIFAANDHVDQLIAAVQAATAKLVPAVKTGDKAAIAVAYTAINNACNACHTKFRKDE